MTEPSVLSLHLDAGTLRKDNGTQPVENGLERVLAGGINLLSPDEIELFDSHWSSLRIGIRINESLDFPTSADVGGKEGHQCLHVFFDLILTVRQVDSPKVATRLQTFDTGL
jgi:hypothetical protein